MREKKIKKEVKKKLSETKKKIKKFTTFLMDYANNKGPSNCFVIMQRNNDTHTHTPTHTHI